MTHDCREREREPESNTRRGRVGKEIAQSLLTGCSQVVICDKKGGENDT